MNDTYIANEGFAEKNRELKCSLIWAGLWVVALVALLVLPAMGR